ncbi:unnamed protein product, partial [marine sediment metagenome]
QALNWSQAAESGQEKRWHSAMSNQVSSVRQCVYA